MAIPLPILLEMGGLALISLFAVEYLFPQPVEAPNAPDTIRLPLPDAPFTGGQCEGVWYKVTCNLVHGNIRDGADVYANISLVRNLIAPVNVELITAAPTVGVLFSDGYFYAYTGYSGDPFFTYELRNVKVVRSDGLPDTCGNRGERPIPETGLADTVINFNQETFNDNSVTIFEGSEYDNDTTTNIFNDASDLTTEAIAALPVAVPAGLAKAVAALSKIVDALQLMDGVLRLLRERSGKDNKSVRMYTYGRIVGDGFLRLYPTGNPTEYEGISVELVALEIPSERGRIFGRHSPNRFKYEPLGRIMFTSGAMGIISTHDIEYPRVSIPIPLGATGFFYHLGLHNNVAFNAVGVYYRIERSLGG